MNGGAAHSIPSARLLASAYYLFIFAALGALLPFLPLLLAGRGFSGAQVGIVLATMPLSDLVVIPLWGMLADMWGARIIMLRAAALFAAAAVLLLLVPWRLISTIFVVALFCVFRAPLVPLADAATRVVLGPRPELYGRVRVWGSIGFAAAAVSVGMVQGRADTVVVTAAVAYLGAFGVALLMGSPPLHRQASYFQQAGALWRQRPLVLLFLGTATYYVGHACFDAYIGLHLVALGFSPRMLGLVWGVGVGAEIVFLWFTPLLLARFDARTLLPLCAAVAALRWLLLSQVTSARGVLATAPLHAVTFGLWYVCVVAVAQNSAAESLRSTAQAYAIASLVLGRFVGYVIGGKVFEQAGGSVLFVAASATALLALLFYLPLGQPSSSV